MALSLEGEHQKAIDVREEQTLPIYREHLGDHPFTATILNNLSNNYCALGKYDIAKQYSEEALKIRRELLKEHYDTAKSLLDLGKVLKKKEEFEEAKLCLGECQGMKRVFDDNTTIMDLERLVSLRTLCVCICYWLAQLCNNFLIECWIPIKGEKAFSGPLVLKLFRDRKAVGRKLASLENAFLTAGAACADMKSSIHKYVHLRSTKYDYL